MKTAYSNEVATSGETKTPSETRTVNQDATISLIEDYKIDYEAQKYLAVKRRLPVTAGDLDGQTYEKYIVRFSEGTPKRWLSFLQEWNELKTQLNLTQGPALYANFKTLLSEDALEKWHSVAQDNGTQTVEHFNQCIKDMTTYVFPENALSNQQNYLSNAARKPNYMTWRQYDVKLHRENNNLALYPPNFNVSQCLPDAVLRGMVHRTAPNYFKEQLKTQGFDTQTNTTKELIKFFETKCESVYRAKLSTQQRKKRTTSKQPVKKKNNKHAKKWCNHRRHP